MAGESKGDFTGESNDDYMATSRREPGSDDAQYAAAMVIADAPGWRIFTTEELEQPSVGHILAENRAGDEPGMPLSSRYAAIVVPYDSGSSPVVRARLIEDDPATGVVAIEVQLHGRTDYIISSMDLEQRQYGPVRSGGSIRICVGGRAGSRRPGVSAEWNGVGVWRTIRFTGRGKHDVERPVRRRADLPSCGTDIRSRARRRCLSADRHDTTDGIRD